MTVKRSSRLCDQILDSGKESKTEYDRLRPAVKAAIWTLDPNELSDLYLRAIKESYRCKRFIAERLLAYDSPESEKCLQELLQWLIANIGSIPRRERATDYWFMRQASNGSSADVRNTVLETLFNCSDARARIQCRKMIRERCLQSKASLLIQMWRDTGDEYCLHDYITVATDEDILLNEQVILASQDRDIIVRAIKKVGIGAEKLVAFLKDNFYCSYLYVCILFDSTYDKAELQRYLDEVVDSSQWHLLIWCLGRLGEKEILSGVFNDYEELSRTAGIRHLERLGISNAMPQQR